MLPDLWRLCTENDNALKLMNKRDDMLACYFLPPLFDKHALRRDLLSLRQILRYVVGHIRRAAHVEHGVLGVVLVPGCARQGNVIDAVRPRSYRDFGCRVKVW